MKCQGKTRGRNAGFSVLEAAIVTGVVSVALCGMIASVNSARALEKRTQQISRASASVAGQVEQLRMAAREQWSSLPANYDAKTTTIASSTTTAAATLATSVATSSTGMTDSSGMWETGATAPNFYFVNVNANVTGSGMGALKFQTYIGNRGAIAGATSSTSTTTPPSGGSTTPPTTTFKTQGEQIAADPVSVTTSGPFGKILAVQLKNQGSTDVTVKRIKVAMKSASDLYTLSLAGTTLYNSTKAGIHSWDSNNLVVPVTIPSGNFDLNLNDICPDTTKTVDRVVTVTLTLSDGSTRTVDIQP